MSVSFLHEPWHSICLFSW